MDFQSISINSSNCEYTDKYILSNYEYNSPQTKIENQQLIVTEKKINLKFKTNRITPSKLGVMLVGLGGNNGSTFVATLLTHKNNYTWKTKEKTHKPNWYGSITQSSTVRMGITEDGTECFAPMSMLVPMVDPQNIIVDGWDICNHDLGIAMEKAQVLDINLQNQLFNEMSKIHPRPGIYDCDFIASNQRDRATNILSGTKQEMLDILRNDIKDFKSKNNLDKVIVLWTANTERFCLMIPQHNDTADNLLDAIKNNKDEISPSTLYAVAAILENCIYINGSPQNTFVPGVIELAEKHNVCIAGDDFKSGQTKIKSVLVDFLVTAGIKPVSIVSYNHLGNNDGKNLSAPDQFRSKEITKSNVVDDMIHSNKILYPTKDDKPDHTIVIKYVPYVGDSKRAMDEYTSEILLDGRNTIVVYNTCEDSLLATPIILDLILLSELFSRVSVAKADEDNDFQNFNTILSVLGYLLKAPLTPPNCTVINSLNRQRACIENILRALLGLAPENNMALESKLNL